MTKTKTIPNPSTLQLLPPRRVSASATFTGHYLDALELVHKTYCTGNKLGEALLPGIELAAKYILEKQSRADAPEPQSVPEAQPMDWDKGDPLPKSLAPEPEFPIQQSLVDAALEPMNLQLPKPLRDQGRPTPPPIPKLTPANIKMLKKVYILDNFYHELGTDQDREASSGPNGWMVQLLRGSSLRVDGYRPPVLIVDEDLAKMKSYPDWQARWAKPNPRWPQADHLVGIVTSSLKPFEV